MSNALKINQEEILMESRTMRDSLADRVEVSRKFASLMTLKPSI